MDLAGRSLGIVDIQRLMRLIVRRESVGRRSVARLNCSNAQIRDKLDDLFARHKIRDIGGLEMMLEKAAAPIPIHHGVDVGVEVYPPTKTGMRMVKNDDGTFDWVPFKETNIEQGEM